MVKMELKKLQHETELLHTASAKEFDIVRRDIKSAIALISRFSHVYEGQSLISTEQPAPLRQIRDSLIDLVRLAKRMPRENRVLDHIFFETMHDREEAIRDAEADTFEWLLQGPKRSGTLREMSALEREQWANRQTATEQLLTWLRTEGGVFHLSGKPGSGKSTAMKLIYNHDTTKESLASWAKDKTLISAHFYFWNSGHSMQMSLEGLYRSILFEVLRACPELIPVLFPAQWASMGEPISSDEGRREVAFTPAMFRPSKISEAFHAMMASEMDDKYRFCFFIDGLDEYRGDSVDHWELAESIGNWCSRESVKCCVSSRPYTEFLATFDERNRLYLHELNKFDIYTFSSHTFQNDRNFKRISKSYDSLVSEVVKRAEGVFLWARLVVRVLLTSIGRFDSEATLFKKLEILPKDLEALYDNLLSGLDSFDRHQSNLLLLITLHNSNLSASDYPLSVLALSYIADLDNEAFASPGTVKVCSNEELADRFEQVKRQVSSLTKGLVEIGPSNKLIAYEKQPWAWIISQRVRFFHRTVPDYLQSNDKLQHEGFDWASTFTRLRLAEIASIDKSNISQHLLDQFQLFQESQHLLDAYISNRATQEDTLASLQLMRSLNSALGPASPPLSWYWVYDYRLPSHMPWFYDSPSYNHYIAYQGHKYYILDQIQRNQRMGDTDDLDIFLSAACGIKPDEDFISRLVDAGYSPHKRIQIFKRLLQPDIVAHIWASTWMVYLGQFVDCILKLCRDEINGADLSEMPQRMRIFARLAAMDVDKQVILSFRSTTGYAGTDWIEYYVTLDDLVCATRTTKIFSAFNVPESYAKLKLSAWPLGETAGTKRVRQNELLTALKESEHFVLSSKLERLPLNAEVCFRLF
jgi:hypothetical protein